MKSSNHLKPIIKHLIKRKRTSKSSRAFKLRNRSQLILTVWSWHSKLSLWFNQRGQRQLGRAAEPKMPSKKRQKPFSFSKSTRKKDKSSWLLMEQNQDHEGLSQSLRKLRFSHRHLITRLWKLSPTTRFSIRSSFRRSAHLLSRAKQQPIMLVWCDLNLN